MAKPMNTNTNMQVMDDTPEIPSRRRFFSTAGKIGAFSALGGFSAATSQQAFAQGQYDFPKPDNLLPGAQLDSRFPVSFTEPVTEGLRLVVAFFTALNQRDVVAMADTLHFPFAIYEDIEPLIYQTRADFISNPPPSLNATGSGYTKIARDSYDLLEGVNVHLYCPVGGVFSLAYTRYNAQGFKLFDCDGVYSVTNNDGRWAIQLISTIWHEAGYEDNEYPDAEMADRIGGQGYLSAFGYRDEALLNDRSTGRGSYEPELPVGTRRASVGFGYGPRDRSQNARDNDPMQGWRTSGVTTRLSVSEVTADTGTGSFSTRLDEFVALAGGTVGEYDYTRLRPDRPLVIHATHDKAHVLNGYWRFTADGTLISETRGMSIRIWKAGNWGDAGGLGQVTHHDRSNSPDKPA